MAPVYGRTTQLSDLLAASKVIQMSNTIFPWRGNVNPLITMLTKIKKNEMVGDFEYNHMIQEVKPPYIETADAYDADVDLGLFSVANGKGAWFRVNDTFWSDAGVQYLVTAVTPGATSSDPDTVQADVWPSTQTDLDLAEGANLIMGPPVHGDVAPAPSSNSVPEEKITNYLTMGMRSSIIGKFTQMIKKYGPDYRLRKRNEMMMAWKADMEAYCILAKKYKDVGGVGDDDIGTIYFGDGIVEQIGVDRTLDMTSTGWDWATFSAWFQSIGTEYSEEDNADLVLMAPPSLFTAIETDAISSGMLKQDTSATRFGFKISELVTSSGNLPLVKSRALGYLSTPTALLLDLNDLVLMGLEGFGAAPGAPKLYTEVQEGTEINKVWDVIQGVIGVKVQRPMRHAPIINFV